MELDNIEKEIQRERDSRKIISTHNIVPPYRKTEKKDIDAFLKKNYPDSIKNKESSDTDIVQQDNKDVAAVGKVQIKKEDLKEAKE